MSKTYKRKTANLFSKWRYTKFSKFGISISFLFIIYVSANIHAQQSTIPDSFQLVYAQSFDSPQAFYDFDQTDPNA